ncbi:porphobilinogen deaminase, dipyromethane cofactor binding domain-containing protein [Syncephalis plumigaleata]|nr:porphobilinogen deaminase, dipyromethane cofactor binding domain-containing protein [Syncephalis plumigaleata]
MTDPYVPVGLPEDNSPEEITQLREQHPDTTFVVGSRKSQLALVQTEHVRNVLRSVSKEPIQLPLTTMTTTGDHILDRPLATIGEKSLFTKELEVALLNGGVDLVVHSLKDLPTTLPEGLDIGAVLVREDPRDAIVLRKDLVDTALGTRVVTEGLSALPAGAVVGTSSVRRRAQLKRAFPHLEFSDVRGNLNTRLRKLDTLRVKNEDDTEGEHTYTVLILAAAGLHRLGWQSRISGYLPPSVCLHAVGQGALAIECRDNDPRTLACLRPLEHAGTRIRVEAERAVMRALEGGCSVPIGVWTEISLIGSQLTLHAVVVSVDGMHRAFGVQQITLECASLDHCVQQLRGQAAKLGHDLAEQLKQDGADDILKAIPR